MKKLLFTLFAITLAACSAQGDTPADQRAAIDKMNNEILAKIDKESPGARAMALGANGGYATFTNGQVNIIFVAAGNGYGVATSKSGRKTYMDMYEAGVGLGMGAKDYDVLFVFHTAEAFNDFVNKGWVFGAEADAAAKTGDKGLGVSGGMTIGDITVFQLTESGLALQATLKGTKYVKNDRLN
ncbi:YSC84-related protein [Thalassotalea ponticola]|uniref:lipid-binding SYLF domain-containing protein n=1 Tax=Thalassotalea ponticola TaxID=1523392 RepID=UPI0025B5D74F|nr:YSC84-related protein [Thalassotalea ponticola]MDN3653399.1 YSC84-related protein [Thalassotalea ponticola]